MGSVKVGGVKDIASLATFILVVEIFRLQVSRLGTGQVARVLSWNI